MIKLILLCFTLSLYLFSGATCYKCYAEDWGRSFDYPGWSTCKQRGNYITGLYRNEDGSRKTGFIFLIEAVRCCMMTDGLAIAVGDNHSVTNIQFERSNVWATCPEGYFVNSLYRDSDIKHHNKLRNIKNMLCSKPKDHPKEWGHCFEKDISRSFDVKGWSSCPEGYFLTGLYKSTCDWINCLERMKCCKISNNYTPSTYHYNFKSKTWTDARKTCLNLGSDLVTIQSKTQNDFLAEELKKRNFVSTWLGLNDIQQEAHFQWVNPLERNNFLNWNKNNNEPNGGRRENCGEMIPGIKYGMNWQGMWNDESCSSVYPFVCQKVEKVDGAWSSWTTYTPCSVSCGMGQRSRYRMCDHPPPKRGGKICKGGMREDEKIICIKPDCP